MNLLFDEDLVEAVVFLCANGQWPGVPALQARRFHSERDRLYRILDPDQRNEAFFKLHLEWFREWGVEKFLAGIAAEFPLLAPGLDALGFRKARGKNEEGAELFVQTAADGTTRRAIVALRAERFVARDALTTFLRHELMHIQDMVSPEFGYSPEVRLEGPATSQQRLVRERYRLLWDITIDGRLSQADRAIDVPRERRVAEMDRVYSFWPEEKRRATFDGFWNKTSPRHVELMALAADPRDLAHAHEPLPGATCPLCNFPTFAWADAKMLAPETVALVRSEFPSWRVEEGLCGRCVETYEAVLSARAAGMI